MVEQAILLSLSDLPDPTWLQLSRVLPEPLTRVAFSSRFARSTCEAAPVSALTTAHQVPLRASSSVTEKDSKLQPNISSPMACSTATLTQGAACTDNPNMASADLIADDVPAEPEAPTLVPPLE